MMSKKYSINFEYADNLSNYEWRKQHCTLYADSSSEAESKCIELYGLGTDCDYRITEIMEVN